MFARVHLNAALHGQNLLSTIDLLTFKVRRSEADMKVSLILHITTAPEAAEMNLHDAFSAYIGFSFFSFFHWNPAVCYTNVLEMIAFEKSCNMWVILKVTHVGDLK